MKYIKILSFLILTLFTSLTYADKDVDILKKYLHNMRSVALDFVQRDSNGNMSEGKLLINKPYKFRCNYYDPFPLLIVGNKNYLSIYDYDMEQINRVSVKENIFSMILSNDEALVTQFKIHSVTDDGEMVKIKLEHLDTANFAVLTFNKNTSNLQEIQIFEGDNIITVELEHSTQVASFDADLFLIKSPDIFGAPKKLSKEQIEKRYKAS